MPLAPGETIAGYTVVRQLGSGGMGAVYLVQHPRLPRLDALKLLKAEFSADPDFSRRFLREADVVAGLSHRNIVAVLDRGEDRGQLWLTMQYIEGIDAEQALEAAGGLLPADRVAHIVTEVAAALDAAHRHHLIHRDVKPANILLSPSDDDELEQVFLTDFGIAKSLESGSTRLTRTGAVLATFDYASPEQIESRSPDARSDIYSLACVLYKLLTGSVPFPGRRASPSAIHGHLQLPPPTPTKLVPWLAPRIDDVVVRAMTKDPAERYQTCRAFAAAAASALVDFPAPPAPPYTVQLTAPTGAVLGPDDHRAAVEPGDRAARRPGAADPVLRPAGEPARGRRAHDHRSPAARRPPVTLEIRAGRSVRRVVADLDEARRPATLDALVEAVEKLPPPPGQAPAPATRLNDLRSAQAAIAARAAQASPRTVRPATAAPRGPPPPRRRPGPARHPSTSRPRRSTRGRGPSSPRTRTPRPRPPGSRGHRPPDRPVRPRWPGLHRPGHPLDPGPGPTRGEEAARRAAGDRRPGPGRGGRRARLAADPRGRRSRRRRRLQQQLGADDSRGHRPDRPRRTRPTRTSRAARALPDATIVIPRRDDGTSTCTWSTPPTGRRGRLS